MKIDGLTTIQAEQIRLKSGPNELPKKKSIIWFTIFVSQIKNPLIYLLIFAGIFSVIYSEYFDALLILAVILLNIIMSFIQEYKAQNTFEALKEMVSRYAIVVRDGHRSKIDIKEIVIGDIVVLGAGDKLPADGLVIESQKLLIKEAILTGEEEAILKGIDDPNLFMGTVVLSGEGLMRVEKIGKDTELGKIGKSIIEISADETPLQKQLSIFAKKFSLIVISLCVVIFIIGIVSGTDVWQMLRIAVILSVAAIPEGLPIAVTVALSIAAKRILNKKGLVKKLLSVETLGSTTVICLDKTGTITEGNMKVVRVDINDENKVIAAVALSNEQRTNLEVSLWNYLSENYKEIFNPIVKRIIRKYEEPFNSEKKYSYAVGELDGKEFACIVGAPDIVIKFCDIPEGEQISTKRQIEEWTESGLRLISFASKSKGELKETKGFTWQGLIGIEDPIREEVLGTLQMAKEAGLKVKIITGDHKGTALRVMKDINIHLSDNEVLEGSDIEKLTDDEMYKVIDNISLFARVTPHHKLRIVQVLKKKGEVVAMTGDGVNDAQALKKADIGVVMGDSSDLAKEAGDLILLNNDFRTIISAIEEGRLVFANIKKIVAYVLSNSFKEIILIVGAIAFGLPIPLTVVMILWIHLICDGPPDIVLSFEPKEQDLMSSNFVNKGKQILDNSILLIIGGVSLVIGILALIIFAYFIKLTGDLAFAQTVTFACIATVDLIYVFGFKSLRQPIYKIKLLSNKWLLVSGVYGFVLLFAALYIPFLNNILGTVQLKPEFLFIQLGVTVVALLWIETIKYFVRKKEKDSSDLIH